MEQALSLRNGQGDLSENSLRSCLMLCFNGTGAVLIFSPMYRASKSAMGTDTWQQWLHPFLHAAKWAAWSYRRSTVSRTTFSLMELRAFIFEIRCGKDSTYDFNSGSTLLNKSSSFAEARIRLSSGVSSDIVTPGKGLGSCLNYAVVLLAGIEGYKERPIPVV